MDRSSRGLRVALVTCAEIPDLTEDDQRLSRALADLRHEPRAVVWNDPKAEWRAYDVAVIRSTWDYHHQPAAFTTWMAEVEAAGVRLVNPSRWALWNIEKTYLRDLRARGGGHRADQVARAWRTHVDGRSTRVDRLDRHRLEAEHLGDGLAAVACHARR